MWLCCNTTCDRTHLLATSPTPTLPNVNIINSSSTDIHYIRIVYFPVKDHHMPLSHQDSGATGAAKTVTSTIGHTVGGLTNTVGGITGAAGRGVGETIEGATGSVGKDVGRGLADAATGVEGGVKRVGEGVKNTGEWKT